MRRCLALAAIGVLSHACCLAQSSPFSYTITTFAGSNFVGDGGLATSAQLAAVEGLATDSAGNLYIADNTGHRIRRVSVSGLISTVAGNGNPGFSGDGGLAVNATINAPYGIAVDKDNKIYFADYGNARIRSITPDGKIRTVAGGGQGGAPGDGSDALGAQFVGPRNVAIDPMGNLYISDYADHRIYRVTPNGQIAVVAGTGTAGNNGDGIALSTRLNFPAGLASDKIGAIYFADSANKVVRKLLAGVVTTVAGGVSGTIPLSGPTGVAMDPLGSLYIADGLDNRLYRRTPDGVFTTLAGADPPLAGPTRDVAADAFGNIYIANGRQVLKLIVTGTMPVAGDGTFGASPENIDATLSYLNGPIGVSVDGFGSVLFVEERGQRVRKVTQGIVNTIAGGASGGSLNDGGPAIKATLIDPVAVAADLSGGVRIADYQGNRVRGVTPSGIIYTVAGDGSAGYGGDANPAASSRLNRPRSVAVDKDGNLYIADSLNHRVRKVGMNSFIGTVAGTGVRGYFGDGGLAAQAQLNAPLGVAVDAMGNLYIADSGNQVIRKMTPAGVISTVAGSGARGFSGDGGPATLAALNIPSSVAVDNSGRIFIADTFNQRIRCVALDGTIWTVAGNGAEGFSGDGGPAASAQLRNPTGVALDALGRLYVADLDNNRIRLLSATPIAPSPVVAENLSDLIVMNAASFRSGPVAPGQILSLFGDAIGPSTASAGRINAIGTLDNTLADTQVNFDGRPAALFYAQNDQINVQAPYAVAGQNQTVVEVFYKGKLRARSTVPVSDAAPGLFTMQRGVGQAIVINPDGTLNSATNPSPRGSIVTLYATGEGATDPSSKDGTPAQAPFPHPLLPVAVMVGTANAEVLFAGAAPGFIGLLQINVRLPGVFTPPGVRPLTISVGSAQSQPGVTVAVQ